MNNAPLMFFELLKRNLFLVGIKQLVNIDPCLFVHKEAICLTHVEKILEATGMSDWNKASVPADPKPLGKDVNDKPVEES